MLDEHSCSLSKGWRSGSSSSVAGPVAGRFTVLAASPAESELLREVGSGLGCGSATQTGGCATSMSRLEGCSLTPGVSSWEGGATQTGAGANSVPHLEGSPAPLERFAQAGVQARAHIQQAVDTDGRRIPWCRSDVAFKKPAMVSGYGIPSLLSFEPGVCDACLLRMPQRDAEIIKQAIAEDMPAYSGSSSSSSSEDFALADDSEDEAMREWRQAEMGLE